MTMSFEETGNLLDELAETFPEALFGQLNGGVNLLPDELADPAFPPEEMYIMGEYCHDSLGRYINLYYGSFAALAEREDWTREVWVSELYETLSHELTHHMEGLSGLHALDDRDEADLQAAHQKRGQTDGK